MRSKTIVMITAFAGLLLAGTVLIGRAPASTTPVRQDVKTSDKCILRITGMTCAGCAAAVKMAARKIDGVSAIEVNVEDGRAEVTFDPTKTTPDAIAQAITKGSGFAAEVQKPAGT